MKVSPNISTISNSQPAVCPKVLFGPAFTIHPALPFPNHACFTAVSAAHKPRGQGEARLGAGDREHRMEPGPLDDSRFREVPGSGMMPGPPLGPWEMDRFYGSLWTQ